jgi:N-acyl-L-homoserine lactone synthetase
MAAVEPVAITAPNPGLLYKPGEIAIIFAGQFDRRTSFEKHFNALAPGRPYAEVHPPISLQISANRHKPSSDVRHSHSFSRRALPPKANILYAVVVSQPGRYVFKQAETEQEFAEIHRLNYRTFVAELGQYPDAEGSQHVDKFHDKNTYFIAMDAGRVAGMISVHDQPPYSIEQRLSDKSLLTNLGPRLLEVRLLAVEPSMRHSMVIGGLLWMVYDYARRVRCSHLLISGAEQRVTLYERLGFRSLGPPVAMGASCFVPMAAALADLPKKVHVDVRRWETRLLQSDPPA